MLSQCLLKRPTYIYSPPPSHTHTTSRTCWVCFATEEDDPGSEWTSPCKCRGATKWVHQLCLQQWIDEKQRGSSSVDVSCPQCQFMYHITYPGASVVVLLYEYANRGMAVCSPMVIAGLTASSLYWISFTYGVTAATFALGRERSIEFFSDPNSSVAIVALPLLPWVIMGVKLFRPEMQILKLWYRFINPAVFTLLKVLPITRSFVQGNHQSRRFIPCPVPVVPFLSRLVVGTFFLPVISSFLGWLLSYVLHTSTLKRTLLVSGQHALEFTLFDPWSFSWATACSACA